nr:receptor-like protein 12 [Ipomoea batatas]
MVRSNVQRKWYFEGPYDETLEEPHAAHVKNVGSVEQKRPPPTALVAYMAVDSKLLRFRYPSLYLVPSLPHKLLPYQTEVKFGEDLSGGFPEFQQNGSLETVSLSFTNFSGLLPDSIGHLHNLSRIELSKCKFTGSIPSTMANLKSLAYVDFSNNNFTGPFPSFQMSKKLIYIDLSHNALTGPLSFSHFNGLSQLKYVNLGSNLLSGQIPSYMFSLPSLQSLYLNDNRFGGQVTEFANVSASQLDTLDLSSNGLNGSIPKSFFKLRKLSVLSLSSNFFSGKMQFSVIQKLPYLSVLDLSYNSLTVDTTNSIEAMFSSPQIRVLSLASCKLEKFPNLRNQSKMVRLDLSDNQIKGRIPNWIWQVGNGGLTLLDLSYNLLENLEEPYRINTSLTVIDLHSNRLQGNLPSPPAFSIYVDYSDNNFSSIIPHEIGNSLVPAVFFSLSKNRLTGPIPISTVDSDTDWLFTFIGLGFGLGMAVGIAPLWFSKQWRTWCDKQLRKLIKQIFPTYGFTYIRYNGARVVAEETIQEFTEDSDEIEDEEEDTEFHGRFIIVHGFLGLERSSTLHKRQLRRRARRSNGGVGLQPLILVNSRSSISKKLRITAARVIVKITIAVVVVIGNIIIMIAGNGVDDGFVEANLSFEEVNIVNGPFKHGDCVHFGAAGDEALEDLEPVADPVAPLSGRHALPISRQLRGSPGAGA